MTKEERDVICREVKAHPDKSYNEIAKLTWHQPHDGDPYRPWQGQASSWSQTQSDEGIVTFLNYLLTALAVANALFQGTV
jgi:hypothetical protein